MKGLQRRFEILESREMLAADIPSFDGSGNNPGRPSWGSVDQQLLRLTTPAYEDGLSAPSGADRPSARVISNTVVDQENLKSSQRGLTDFVWAWGQFLDHDIDLSEPGKPEEPFNIPVPAGDPFFDPAFTGTQEIALDRTLFDPETGVVNPRQQLNEISSFIDGSNVYGSDDERAAALRAFYGGLLKTSAGNFLPFNTEGLPNAMGESPEFFLAGDVRANENVILTSMHTLFVREHNRLARELASTEFAGQDLHDPAVDEAIFQAARRVVASQIQAITYNEFLPALLGPSSIDVYSGYDSSVSPNIANEFSTAAFRIGHTMLSPTLLRLDADGNVIDEGNLALRDAFFQPEAFLETGMDPLLRGAAQQLQQEIDVHVIDDVRNFLFGPPGAGGFDLASLNIQRGRDHGIASYNQVRIELGLGPVYDFSDISSDPEVVANLRAAYGDVNKIDLWVGGLAEDHVPGTNVGETFTAIMVDQFERLRASDRFWYENRLSPSEIVEIDNTQLSDIIARNTGVQDLQENVFLSESVLYYQEPAGSSNGSVQLRRVGDHLELRNENGGLIESRPAGNVTRVVVTAPLDDRAETFTFVVDGFNALGTPVEYRSQGDGVSIMGGPSDDHITLYRTFADLNGERIDYGPVSVMQAQGLGGPDYLTVGEPILADVSLFGDSGNDNMTGSEGRERMFGGPGHDTMFGRGSADYMSGDAGDDYMNGGAGYDTMLGGPGSDTMLGDSGDDVMEGGDGGDVMEGGAGRDTMYGGDGPDTMNGGGANDLMYGEGGPDLMQGADGADSMLGGPDNDAIYGDGGHDRLIGDYGDDVIYGDVGRDTIYGGPGADFVDAGGANDLVYGGPDNDTMLGGSGGDKMFGGGGDDAMGGGDGRDRMYGQNGNDLMSGGADDDELNGGNGDDWMYGGSGDDKLIGDRGDDYLVGNAGNDWLDGGLDSDWIFAGLGYDHLLGRSGDDYLIRDSLDSYDAGAGLDTLIDESGFQADSEKQSLPYAALDRLLADWSVWESAPLVQDGTLEIEFPGAETDELAQLAS